MSPEQLQGGRVDGRSDVFSLGVVLYEAATGANPFAGRSTATTLLNVLQLDPPPLSSRRPLSFGPLEQVVQRCLKKAPAARYESAAALLADLRGARAHWDAAAPARPAARRTPPYRWWQFHQISVTFASGLMLVPLWMARAYVPAGVARNALFFGFLAAFVVSAVLRSSAAFLAWQDWAAFRAAVRRRRVAVMVVDTVMTLLAGGGALLTLPAKPGLAALLLGASLALLLTLYLVEPVTTKAAFEGVGPPGFEPGTNQL